MKSKSYYFKIAFFPIGLGLFAGIAVYSLIMAYTDDATQDIGHMLTRALTISFGTALVMGILNTFAKIDVRKTNTL